MLASMTRSMRSSIRAGSLPSTCRATCRCSTVAVMSGSDVESWPVALVPVVGGDTHETVSALRPGFDLGDGEAGVDDAGSPA